MEQRLGVVLVVLVSVCVALVAGLATPASRVERFPLKFTHAPADRLEALPHYRHAIKQAQAKANPAPPTNQELYGNILPTGIYWTYVLVGTPSQKFYVAVDTGSGDLVFPQAGCTGCHPDVTGSYDPQASSTSSLVSCRGSRYECSCQKVNGEEACVFSATYETCNLTAPTQPCTIDNALYSDVIQLGTQSTPGVFGAIYHQTKNFQQLFFIDGIMGFIPSQASAYGGISAFETLVEAGLYNNQFGICLNASAGGVITLGGIDSSLYSGDFQYTPLDRTQPYYAVGFKNLQVGGNDIDTDGHTMIIDSGTNTLLVDSTNYKGVTSQLVSQLCPDFTGPGVCNSPSPSLFDGGCFDYTADEIAAFPTVSILLDGATLEITGEDYLVQPVNSTQRCFGIANSGPHNLLIIGDVVMQKYYTLFDNVNHQLGWASVVAENCQ